ncbi:MAG: DUF1697 domain-containing protein [Actinobacteria bacterium]|nr:DUF1697 domain-containing protein [Actinomycetota bacterium]
MTTYVALLRGVNVGGHNRLAMADLRALLTDLGHSDPRTYLQSGNAVFSSDRTDADDIGRELAQRLSDDLDVTATVMIRTADELTAVAAANPYSEPADADPTKVHVAFLSAEPADPSVFDVEPDDYAPEELTPRDRVLYLHLPDGIGRSRLADDVSRRASDVDMTVRNWRTVARLLDLIASR